MFFGGFGALSREFEALYKGSSKEETNLSTLAPGPVKVTVAAITDATTLESQAAKEGATHTGETSTLKAHQPAGLAMVVIPWLTSSQASGTVAAEEPMKRYRVTIEEISKGEGEREKESSEGEQVRSRVPEGGGGDQLSSFYTSAGGGRSYQIPYQIPVQGVLSLVLTRLFWSFQSPLSSAPPGNPLCSASKMHVGQGSRSFTSSFWKAQTVKFSFRFSVVYMYDQDT